MKIKEKISMSRNIQKIIHIVERKYEKNSKNEFYIEFPDDFNSYDAQKRQWVTKKIK